MHKRLFQRVCSKFNLKKLQVLEVASGYADVLQAASLMLKKQNISLQISPCWIAAPNICRRAKTGTGTCDPRH